MSGEGVYFLNRQSHFLHQAHDIQNRERADAIANKVGRIFGDHDTLAQQDVAEVSDGVDRGPVRLRSGNDFQQAHVARRIKEVCAKPGAAEIVGKSFRNFPNRQSARVGGDHRPGLAYGFHSS